MKGVSIYPSRDLKRELEKCAKKDNRSLNNFILYVLTKYMRSKR